MPPIPDPQPSPSSQTPTSPGRIPPPELAAPAVSPTGAPMVPAKLVPYFFAAATVCAIVAGASQIPGLGLPPAVFGWATLGASLFAALCGLTPGMRKAVPVVLLVLSLGLASCAHTSPLQVTGESLDAAAIVFEATAVGMASAAASQSLTAEQVRAWNAFLPRFKASYHLAVSLWRSARVTQDKPLEEQAAAVLASMLSQLGEFEALVLARPDGGAA